MANKITHKDIISAYKKLIMHTTFDRSDYIIKNKINEFEHDENAKQARITKLLNIINESHDKDIESFLDSFKIDVLIRPKKCEPSMECEKDQLITDGYSNDPAQVKVTEFNYFIDADIEIHIITVLWLMSLKDRFVENNYAYKLHKNYKSSNSDRLFTNYYYGYNDWRNKAASAAKSLNDKDKDGIIISLDIKQYYYSIDVTKKLISNMSNNQFLSKVIFKICQLFSQKLYKFAGCDESISRINQKNVLLPIGLLSSGVLANYYLTMFDKKIISSLKPQYYGRYVDDMLVVLDTTDVSLNKKIDKDFFLKKFFIENDILTKTSDNCYQLATKKNLKIQPSKINIIYSRRTSKINIFRKIKSEVTQQSSEFRFLIDKYDFDKKIESSLGQIKFQNDDNKIRNVKEFYNVKFEFSTTVSIAINKLMQDNIELEQIDSISESIFAFYDNPINVFNAYLLIEKSFQFLILTRNYASVNSLLFQIQKTIKLVRIDKIQNSTFISNFRKHFSSYVDNALNYAISKVSDIAHTDQKFSTFYESLEMPEFIKDSNIFNYNYYNLETNHGKYLKKFNKFIDKNSDTNIDDRLYSLNTKFINKEEQLTTIDIDKKDKNNYHEKELINVGIVNFNINEFATYNEEYLLRKIFPENWTNSSNKSVKQAIMKKHEQINTALSAKLISKKDIDLIVLPENSIPYSMLKRLVKLVYEQQVAMVFGLEHIVIPKTNDPEYIGIAYNFQVALLPYYNKKLNKKDVFIDVKLKSHYSPKELDLMSKLRLKIPFDNFQHKSRYKWKGVFFSIFNCYEFTNVSNRASLLGAVDFICVSAQNPDITTFSNIIESTSTDIHCYIIQANNSKYGDSRVTAPTSRDTKDIIKVKGGKSTVVLIDSIDIKALRTFQLMPVSHQINSDKNPNKFKPTPPNFYNNFTKERLKINNNDI